MTGDSCLSPEEKRMSSLRKTVRISSRRKSSIILGKSQYISEVIVEGAPQPDGELIVTAHIVPDRETISEQVGDLDDAQMKKFFKKIIDDTNEQMPSYKRVKRFVIRNEEFEKTSTKKIKRFGTPLDSTGAEKTDAK